MSGEKITDILLEHFSGFILSGIVFTIFSILLPFGLWVYLCGKAFQPPILSFSLNIIEKINTPFLFIITVFCIGILLDLLKLWRFWNQLPFFKTTWVDLKVSIVKSFDIEIGNDPCKNMANIKKIANLIHKTFIKTKHPEIDRRIEVNRIYHETLSMSFFSILSGIILSIFITIVNAKQERCTLLMVLIFLFVAIYWVGKGKVSHELSETNKFIEALFRKTFLDNTDDCRSFVKELHEKEELVIKDTGGKWKVKEP